MVCISRRSTTKFDELQVDPQDRCMVVNSNDLTAACCLLSKQLLKAVTITITDENMPDWRFIKKLRTFDNFEHLVLSWDMPDLNAVCRIIDNCNQLKTLKFASRVDAKNPQLTKAKVWN